MLVGIGAGLGRATLEDGNEAVLNGCLVVQLRSSVGCWRLLCFSLFVSHVVLGFYNLSFSNRIGYWFLSI